MLLLAACQPEKIEIVPGQGGGVQTDTTSVPSVPDDPVVPDEPAGPVIPAGLAALPHVEIETPGRVGIYSKTEWTELATIKITGDGGEILYEADSLKIRGRGNSTWTGYPKKSYYIKLNHKADLYGTGKSRKWVLLANWMDRTLLRHHVAFEAARRTSIEWTPYGQFVELYLNGKHLGNYWLGEKINVEGSKFTADYLYSLDTSDADETDFYSYNAYRVNAATWGVPVELKYPDRDDYADNPAVFWECLDKAESTIEDFGSAVSAGSFSGIIDTDSFCDWYLVHELCYNIEPNHPKSCFFYWRDGKMYAGPVWDFDWWTFVPGHYSLDITNCIWFSGLLANSAFKTRLKERWTALKPSFEGLLDYIDEQADIIRESEAVNHEMWPCYPNQYSEDWSGMVNHDEQLTFQQAVDRMKEALEERLEVLDKKIPAL